MPHVQTISFQGNVEYEFIKLYNAPLQRNGRNGQFWSYTVMYNGDKVSFAAGKALHDKIESENIPVNDSFTITKKVDGNNTIWVVNGNGDFSQPVSNRKNNKISVNSEMEWWKVWDNVGQELSQRNINTSTADFMDIQSKITSSIFIQKYRILENLMRSGEVVLENPFGNNINQDQTQDDLPF